MIERYQKTIIRISAEPVGSSRWKPKCEVRFNKNARIMLKHLELTHDYNTSQQAERAGMVFSKKWVDAGKPAPLVRAEQRKFFDDEHGTNENDTTKPICLETKRNERAKEHLLKAFMNAKKEGVEVHYFEPYLILYKTRNKAIQIFRLDQTELRKMFQDSPT